MDSSSLQNSFWLVLLVSFIMVGLMLVMAILSELGEKLKKMAPDTMRNWTPWVYTLLQTAQGIETIAYTVYGNAIGTFVLLIYIDIRHAFPLFLYFLPFYLFLFGFYGINQESIRSYSLRAQTEGSPAPSKVAVLKKGGALLF